MTLDTINAILDACVGEEPHPADLGPLDDLVVMGLIELVEESDHWIDAIPSHVDDVAWTVDNPF